ncbi:unnamed protein product, partial [marine sediment metagenome]
GLSDLIWMIQYNAGLYAYVNLRLRNKTNGRFFGYAIGSTVRNLGGNPNVNPNLTAKKIGDFNGDGNIDIVWMYGSLYDFKAYVALGDGQGHFTDKTSMSRVGSYQKYYRANRREFSDFQNLVADVNNDGLSDLIWMSSDNKGVYAAVALALEPDSSGVIFNFAIDRRLSQDNFSATPNFVTKLLGDVNGDGVIDLIYSFSGAGYNFEGDRPYHSLGIGAYYAIGRGDGTFHDAISDGTMAANLKYIFRVEGG